jgi:phosphate transport system permease protein
VLSSSSTRSLADPALRLRGSRAGARGDSVLRTVCVAAGLLVLAILVLILFSTVKEAMPAFRASGLDFITSDRWVPNDPDGPQGPAEPQFGALAFVYGSLVVSAVALVVSVPVSLGIGLFTTEVAPRRLRSIVITIMDLLAAIPSVVYGLWGILVVAPNIAGFYDAVNNVLGQVPVLGRLFGEPVTSGRSFMTAGLILAIMITPIITSVSREVFATVPEAEKQGALALGATRWEMIRGAVLPHSFAGVVGAIMLGLGRAIGETIAVALTIGASAQVVSNLLNSGNAMPAVIVQQFGESSGTFRSALIGLGVFLFVITVVVNLAARRVVRRAEIRFRGA